MLVVPVYNKIVLPHADIYFQAEEFNKLANEKFDQGTRVVLVVSRENVSRSKMTGESFYPIGVSGVVSEINAQGYIRVKTFNRVDIRSAAINPDLSIDLELKRRMDEEDLDENTAYEKLMALKEECGKVAKGFQWADAIGQFIKELDTVESLICALSPWMNMEPEDRYALLEIDSRKERTEKIEKLLYEYLESVEVNKEANIHQQAEYQAQYREQAIKKQIEYLQEQLDEMHPENLTDVQRFEKAIAEGGMNEDAKKEATKVLNRLKQEGQNGTEYGLLYDYLDFVTGLSWKKQRFKYIDLDKAQKILDEDHSGLKKVKERILQQIAVMNLKKKQSGSILLFVGAPGTGKTSIGRSIARAMGRKYVRVSLGGVRDEADIRGHRRTYIGAMPGRIMDGISKSGVSNPVMVLDEVDKLSESYNGDPASALLEVLDPEQNNTFTDHYMNVPYDLSDVLFICTANTTDTIPEPLLNRMEVINFTGYTPEEKMEIARDHLLPKAEEAMGIKKDQIVISDEVLQKIINDYTMESGVRGLRKRLDTLCRRAAVQISRNPDEPVTVTQDNLRDLLDMHPVLHDKVLTKTRPGVVTGLAWTQAGGEILYIETLFTKSSSGGNVILTGQLGDVMKESAQIAVSLVKALYPEKAKLFEENDLHIHVPEGAVKKDGPSAGITLTTAIASLVTGKEFDPATAMTGEVSLRGAVTAIGGLPEKLMAAQRAGVKRVYIPKDNVEDLKDVAQQVRDQLEIIPVSDVTDVLCANGMLDKVTSFPKAV